MAAQLNTRLRFVRTLTVRKWTGSLYEGLRRDKPCASFVAGKRPNLSRYMDQLIGFEEHTEAGQ